MDINDDRQPGLKRKLKVLWDGSFASTGTATKTSRTQHSHQNSSVRTRLSRVPYEAERKEVRTR